MSIFEEAEAIVNGPRQNDYDHPLDNFTRIAKMWSVILGVEVEWWKVPLCMEATKISREMHRPRYDNRVDGIGYWGALQMGYEEELRREWPAGDPVSPDDPGLRERFKAFTSPTWEQLELPFDE